MTNLRIAAVVGLILVSITAGISPARAEMQVFVEEYEVKAAFLFNFAKFVEWPASAFRTAGDPINICVLGKNPFGGVLQDAVRNKTLRNRTFAVRAVSTPQEACRCQILFVAAGYKNFAAISEYLKTSTVLTVGESDDFSANGGIITFRVNDGHVRFDIDATAAERAQLRISSKLLSLGQTRKR